MAQGVSLVTGATGFLGEHLVDSLLRSGETVVMLWHNRFRQRSYPGLGEGIAVFGDVRDLEFMRRTLARYGVGTVYHLAAQTQVSIAHVNPIDTFDVNVRGTWTVLEACRLEGVRRLVVASSDKVYGECSNVDELEFKDPKCQYGVSKACADEIAQSFNRNYDMSIAVTRCGNLYGPGDTHWRRLISGACRAAIRGEPYQLRTDGTGIRDYLFIDDAVAFYRALAASEYVGPFNYSGGEPKSAIQVINAIHSSIGRVVPAPILDTSEVPELKTQTLCCDKARKLLGIRPATSFDIGMSATVKWYKTSIVGRNAK